MEIQRAARPHSGHRLAKREAEGSVTAAGTKRKTASKTIEVMDTALPAFTIPFLRSKNDRKNGTSLSQTLRTGRKQLIFQPVFKFFNDGIGKHLAGDALHLGFGCGGIEGVI